MPVVSSGFPMPGVNDLIKASSAMFEFRLERRKAGRWKAGDLWVGIINYRRRRRG